MQEPRLTRLVVGQASAGSIFKLLHSYTSAYIEALIEMDFGAECAGETQGQSF